MRKLRTIAQLQEFLAATPEVRFTGIAPDGAHDDGRYAHISRVLQRFDYPRRKKSNAVLSWPTLSAPAATAARSSSAWWHAGTPRWPPACWT